MWSFSNLSPFRHKISLQFQITRLVGLECFRSKFIDLQAFKTASDNCCLQSSWKKLNTLHKRPLLSLPFKIQFFASLHNSQFSCSELHTSFSNARKGLLNFPFYSNHHFIKSSVLKQSTEAFSYQTTTQCYDFETISTYFYTKAYAEKKLAAFFAYSYKSHFKSTVMRIAQPRATSSSSFARYISSNLCDGTDSTSIQITALLILHCPTQFCLAPHARPSF